MRLMRRDWCGPSIREMREKLGFSQTGFGERFGIPLRTLQHWEAYEKETAKGEVIKDGRKPPYYVYVLLYEIIYTSENLSIQDN